MKQELSDDNRPGQPGSEEQDQRPPEVDNTIESHEPPDPDPVIDPNLRLQKGPLEPPPEEESKLGPPDDKKDTVSPEPKPTKTHESPPQTANKIQKIKVKPILLNKPSDQMYLIKDVPDNFVDLEKRIRDKIEDLTHEAFEITATGESPDDIVKIVDDDTYRNFL